MEKNDEKEFELVLKKIGERIQYLREKANLTQENMAEGKYSIEYKYLQRIEYGQKNITLKTIYKLCKKLGVDMKDIFDD